MKDYLERMIIERDELESRISFLTRFVESYLSVSFGCEVDLDKFMLMSRQLGLMIGYLDILEKRIDLETGEKG